MNYTPKQSKDHKGWYLVPGYPYFLANRDGKLKNSKTGYETYGSKDDRGYLRVCLWNNDTKTKKDLKSHVLICLAFNGPKPNAASEVGHKDDVRDNNKSNNLHWTTRKKNMEKANRTMEMYAW